MYHTTILVHCLWLPHFWTCCVYNLEHSEKFFTYVTVAFGYFWSSKFFELIMFLIKYKMVLHPIMFPFSFCMYCIDFRISSKLKFLSIFRLLLNSNMFMDYIQWEILRTIQQFMHVAFPWRWELCNNCTDLESFGNVYLYSF